MRWFCLALTLWSMGCGDDCTVDTACSASTDAHYRFCNAGKADDCYFATGDGQKLHCVSCGDCENAQEAVTAWCSDQPDRGRGPSGTTGLTCESATCPNGNSSYQFCTSTGASGCQYKTSDGKVFTCNSCSDCTAAATSAANWCINGSGGSSGGTTTGSTTSCTSGSDCQTCCAEMYPAGAQAYANLYSACTCPLCNAQCGGTSQCVSNTADCIQCLTNAAQTTCQQALVQGCGNNADCADFLDCENNCG